MNHNYIWNNCIGLYVCSCGYTEKFNKEMKEHIEKMYDLELEVLISIQTKNMEID